MVVGGRGSLVFCNLENSTYSLVAETKATQEEKPWITYGRGRPWKRATPSSPQKAWDPACRRESEQGAESLHPLQKDVKAEQLRADKEHGVGGTEDV